MKKLFKLSAVIGSFFLLSANIYGLDSTIESRSSINWITRTFTSNIALDTEKSNLIMPSGKQAASMNIKTKMPQLIQNPLLSLYENSAQYLADSVVNEVVTLDQVYEFITTGYKTPDVFTSDAKLLKTTNSLKIDKIGSLLVKHNIPYTPEEPINQVASRKYSGIIIDARGSYPVHGEYISSEVYPCFFPQIWDEEMNLIFEKNMTNPDLIKDKGLVSYNYSDDLSQYENRVGSDPLYIKTVRVFGRNRTDPIIKKKDALKILSIPENIELLKQGKIVILLDKQNLIYDIATADKDEAYYVNYNNVKQYIYTNKIPVQVVDDVPGIVFSVDLKFYPDSSILLPSEKIRIEEIGRMLKDILKDDGYTVLIEGHTADVGKPVGQLNLSIERTQTVMNALVNEGIERNLFTYKGYGGIMPIASNATEEGRAQNRRVDITARPKATYIQRDW